MDELEGKIRSLNELMLIEMGRRGESFDLWDFLREHTKDYTCRLRDDEFIRYHSYTCDEYHKGE